MINNPVIMTINNLNHIFDMKEYQVNALNNLSFEVRQGEFIGLIGPSGSGKTTLINCLSGMLKPSSGEVRINDVDITSFSPSKIRDFRLRSIGLVFQEHLLVESLNVFENIEIPLIFGRVPSNERKIKVNELIMQFGLDDKRTHLPNELSGGEQQRVGIARALVFNPEIILADEPTGDLDTRNSQLVIKIFKDIVKGKKKSVVMVSHDPRHQQYFDRVLELSDGNLIRGEI